MSNLCDNCENPSWTGEDPIPAPPYPGGGEAGDFDDLSNRPKYDSTELTGSTNIPKVPTTAFSGATASEDGTKGLVPAPDSGQEGQYLKGDGSWGDVEYAETAAQLVTDTQQAQISSFPYRTSGGTLSIDSGKAELVYVKGKTVEVITVTNNFEVKDNSLTGSPAVSINETVWMSLPWGAHAGTYTFTTQAGGKVSVESEDGTISQLVQGWFTPLTGIIMVPNKASLQSVGSSVTIEFTQSSTMTLKTAKPIGFESVGYNQAPGADDIRLIADNEYRIACDSFTSIEVTPFDGSAIYTITPDENNKFTPAKSGWGHVNDAVGQVLIALVWSGSRDNDPWESTWFYEKNIPMADKNGNALPPASYGFPSVGEVADEVNYHNKQYIQRVGHYAYSAENLEIVQALDTTYTYDSTDIFYVLDEPIVYELPEYTTGVYTVNDYGTEWFIVDALGTPLEIPLETKIIYGSNLVDKLRNLADIQEVGDGLTLDDGMLSSSSIIELTEADYNYPENAPTSVALWLLKPGFYTRGTGVSVKITTTTSLGSDEVAVVGKAGSFGQPIYVLYVSSTAADGFCFCDIYNVTWLGTSSMTTTLCAPVNALTSTSVNAPLSANQGRVLKELVDSLVFKNAGAPTTATVGAVGQLLEDTTNGKLYICTAADTVTPAYTWVEVGSGGGGGGVTVLTPADYNYPESGTKTSVALWKLPAGLYYADNAASLNTALKVYANDTGEYYYYSTFLVFEDAQSQGYVTIYGLMGSDGNTGHIWKVWKQNGNLSDSLSIPTVEYIESTFQYAPDGLCADDYDYPEEDPDGIAVWNLGANTNYTFSEPVKMYLNSTTSFTCSTSSRFSIGNTSGSNKFFEFVICENGTTDVTAGFGFTNQSTGAKVTLKSYTTSDIAANVSNNANQNSDPSAEPDPGVAEPTVTCPFCGQQTSADSTICQFCGNDITGGAIPDPGEEPGPEIPPEEPTEEPVEG